MPPEETAVKLTLDKPLNELTEDDIAQLTREDCRRYLKEKGMRRPSWNKSQAIQQVIMLKKLLEPTPDSDAGSRKKLRVSSTNNTQHSNIAILESVPERTGGDAENSEAAEETIAYRRKDLDKPDSVGGFPGRFTAANEESGQASATGSANTPVGQMTIFYCGKVNVYDDVPADKAKEILHVAASPLQFPEAQMVNGTTILQPLPSISKAASTKAHQDSAAVVLRTPQTVRMSDNSLLFGEESNILCEETPVVEGSSTRKASLQRYLEKRKDRFKGTRKAGMTSCASLDMYFNHQMSNQFLRSGTCFPHQIRSPSAPARCSSVDNDSVKNTCLTAGLSNKGLWADSTGMGGLIPPVWLLKNLLH